ncbi:EF-hand calcium-binding domain-containing protein 9 [Tyto alba]|uniref:EF-hand calcium-binding domain-containing protein 9 n=1 Tax=Tyto alba TaxID=56313 RepID=UPI001C679041|nr:EF-hand calcium-binding domain-containing protein 9 [Tyto alba]
MKLKSGCFLQHLHLDEVHCLLSVRNAAALAEYFQLLDYLNNLRFYCFLRYVTDLNKDQSMLLFDLLDQNNYLEKQFIYRHTGPTFQWLNIDRDNMIDFNDFKVTRFLFNIQKELQKIFKDFDIPRDEQLNYREFKMIAVFCIDKQQKEEEIMNSLPAGPVSS